MAISCQSQCGLRQDAVDKRIGFCTTPVKLGGGVTHRVDLAPELLLQRQQQLQHAAQLQILAHQHHVDITLRRLALLGHGTKSQALRSTGASGAKASCSRGATPSVLRVRLTNSLHTALCELAWKRRRLPTRSVETKFWSDIGFEMHLFAIF